MTNLTELLSSKDGKEKYIKAFNHLLRSQNFEKAEALLRKSLQQDNSELAKLSLRALETECHFSPDDWDNISQHIVNYSKDKDLVGAVGFDLTGHWDYEVEGGGPGFEVNFYPNDMTDYKFSDMTHREILEKTQNNKYPDWSGRFIGIELFGPIMGLDDLFKTLRKSKDAPIYLLGIFTLHLKVQQTFKKELDQYGLPQRLPVLLGTHDFIGRYSGYNVIMNTKRTPYHTSYQEMVGKRRRAHLISLKKRAQSKIEACVTKWDDLRRNMAVDPDAHFVKSFKAAIHYELSMAGVKLSKEIEDHNEMEFKQVMENLYNAILNRAH